jgi:hypothetical protein
MWRGIAQYNAVKGAGEPLSSSSSSRNMESRRLSPYPEPPTELSLTDARRNLHLQRSSLTTITKKIDAAELELAHIIADSRCTINEMQRERIALENRLSQTMAYIAPIRRLPNEVLRHIFMFNFDDYPCCAWVLAAVCSLWRRLALSMPKMWSQVSCLGLKLYITALGIDMTRI